eukprot:418689-Alexandrium_andersonii.AAC.1
MCPNRKAGNAGGVQRQNKQQIPSYDSQPGSNDWAPMTGARLGIVAQSCLFVCVGLLQHFLL